MPFFENYGNNFTFYYKHYPYPTNQKNIIHMHPHYELAIFNTYKSYTMQINGDTYEISRPSVAIFSPYSMHQTNFTQGDRIERMIFYFGDTFINEHPAEFGAFKEYQKHMFTWLALSDETVIELRPFFDILSDTTDLITQKMIFLVILNRLLSPDKNEQIITTQSGTKNMNDIVRYISEHFNESITAESVAQRFFISRSKLNKDFRQYTGISFHQLVDELRLSRAMHLLTYDNADIAKTSSALGFENETYFFAFFKKMTGMTPRQYLRSRKKQ